METIVYAVGLFLEIVAAVSPVLAQTPKEPEFDFKKYIAELDQKIAKAPSDTARVKLLQRKGQNLFDINYDSAIFYAERAATLAKRINFVKGEEEVRLTLASFYSFKGKDAQARAAFRDVQRLLAVSPSVFTESEFNYLYGTFYSLRDQHDSAIIYFKKNIPLVRQRHDDFAAFTEFGTFNNLALSYQRSAKFQQALQFYQRALRLPITEYNPSMRGSLYLNMGLVYIAINDTLRAEQSMLTALRLARNKGGRDESSTYVTLTALYDFKHDYNRLYQYAMKAAPMCRQQGDLNSLTAVLSRAAWALSNQKKYSQAEWLNRQAIKLADSLRQSNTDISYEVYANMGSILTLQGKYSMALPFFEQALRVLGSSQLFDHKIRRFYNNLALCYEKTGNYAKALTAFRTATSISDSARNRENLRKTVEQHLNFDYEKKQAITRLARQAAEAKAHTRQVVLGTGLGVAILLTALLFWGYRTKQRDNALLQQQKQEIERTFTQLKTTQTQLIHKEKMASLGELTAGIAHEIQNPLNFVNNYSELSAELVEELEEEQQKPTPDANLEVELLTDLKDNLSKILHHGTRASSIVKGMLEHARRSDGERAPTNLNKLIEDYLRLAYHGLRAKDNHFNADLATEFDESAGDVVMIAQEIGRVFLNLFNNAFYAVRQQQQLTPEAADYQPLVRVRTERQPSQVVVSVRDNGVGMSEAVMTKIFQPFFTTKPTGEGTGLGLSLSYDIVTKGHGGSLTVSSQPGQGAEFMITLPLQPTTA